MVWVQLVWFLVSTAISIALAPKPRAPKAAAIEDFQVPTAEEGRPIPVVFGTVDISGPNCLWYGDLDVKKIKKRSGFSKQTVGYKYYLGFHLGLCHGEADEISRITYGDKEAWTGSITANGSGTINAPNLLGGTEREGGISGNFDVMFGGNAQAANAYLSPLLGGDTTAYRGIVSFVLKKGYIGTTPYVKPIGIRVKRIHKGWQGAEWYPEKAELPGGLMNPAHIIYQALTDTEWGCGMPTSFLNDAVWRDTADQFYDEAFGLALIWNQQSTIQQFVQIVVDHCAANLALRNDTGQYELTAIRGNYDPDDLITLDPSNVVELQDYQRPGWGETVNEVTLVYTDPDTGKDTTIAAHDLGNQAAQQKNIPQTVELKGIRNHTTAQQVVQRELQSRSTPLGKGTLIANRDAWRLPYGEVFKFTWPERDLEDVVHRVLSINRGKLQENTVVVEFVEDVYALELAEVLTTNGVDPDPDAVDTPPDDPDPGIGVISTTDNTPPLVVYPGDSYFVPLSPPATGAWAGHEGETADWDEDENAWAFTPPADGQFIYDQNTGITYQVQGGALVPFGGGSLTIVDLDDSPDEVITNVTDIQFKDVEVTDLSTGGVIVKVSPLTAKGDLYTHDGALVARLPVGADGQILYADSGESTGLLWDDPPAGGGGSGGGGSSSGAPLGISYTAFSADAGGWGNFTMNARVRGHQLLNVGASFKYRFYMTVGGLKINKMVARRTLANDLTFIDSVNITIGGTGAQTLSTPGTIETDEIPLAIDVDHDYYVLIYFDSTTPSTAKVKTGADSFATVFAGDNSGDHTADASATSITVGNGAAYGAPGMAIF